MSLLTDDSLVHFADRDELLNHVRQRGAARRRRVLALRSLGLVAAIALVLGVPMSQLLGGVGARVETLPIAGQSDGRAEGPAAANLEGTQPGGIAEHARPGGSSAPAGGMADPGGERAGAGGGSPTPTRVPLAPGTDGDDECSVREVRAPVVAAGDGPRCYFYAASQGGYEATGDWRISIRRGDTHIVYSSFLGSPTCGKTGTIQPGDYVEVIVKTGTAGAGRSYGTSCGT